MKGHSWGQAEVKLGQIEVKFLGKLPDWHEVKWRKDSCLEDGMDFGVDLSGGFFDAGDYMKFTFPLAFTMNVLSWSLERGCSITCSNLELPNYSKLASQFYL